MTARPWWLLPRSLRRRIARRAPAWTQEPVVSPYADRLQAAAVNADRCHVIVAGTGAGDLVASHADFRRERLGLAVGSPWWADRRQTHLMLGYRRWCPGCTQMRMPVVDVRLSWESRRKPLRQLCDVCYYEWAGEPTTSNVDAAGSERFVLRLRGDQWHVSAEMSLDSLRISPDVRRAADAMWRRLERAGQCIEAGEGHR